MTAIEMRLSYLLVSHDHFFIVQNFHSKFNRTKKTEQILFDNFFNSFVIYGRIGMVIAHEIIHGFDTNGRYFDEHGNLFQWWNNETDATYRETERCIVEQYSNYTYEQVNMTLNGNTTRSEDIADIAGTELAFLAYRQWLKVHGDERRLPLLDKYTTEQMFFISFGQVEKFVQSIFDEMFCG
jgi:predicted metalloendopeptidase